MLLGDRTFLRELLDYEAGVLAAETEAIRESYVDLDFAGYVRNVVEITVGVGFILVDRWVKNAVVDAVDADDGFERP